MRMGTLHIGLGAMVILGLAGLASAGSTTWLGGTANWTSSNWNPAEPTSSDDAYINSGTAQITLTGEVCSYLYLGNETTDNGAVDLSGTGQLSAASNEYIGYYGTGNFAQSGGVNAVTNTLNVGAQYPVRAGRTA